MTAIASASSSSPLGEELRPPSTLDETSRYDMLDVIDNMDAMGGTALIDAVYAAVEDLQSQRDDHINAGRRHDRRA